MVTKEILQSHYREYAAQPEEWVANMAATKKSIVKCVVEELNYHPREKVRVAVLGASDKRYLSIHEKIFCEVFCQPVEVVTYDLDSKHLKDAGNVVEHDVTEPFPQTGFSVVFSHELLKFLTPSEQVQALRNAYHALQTGGIAMHVVHAPSLYGTAELREWQYRVDPNHLLENVANEAISGRLLRFESESNVDWLRETCVILFEKR